MGTTPPLSDQDYLALAIWDEARGERYDGKLAVCEVIVNRRLKHYASDGTIRGTVLHPNQFSGFYFDMVDGRYQRVCHDEDAADIRAHRLLLDAQKDPSWGDCEQAACHLTDPMKARYLPQLYNVAAPELLPADCVLYYNPAVVHSPPAWATPDKYVATIGHHAFYRA